MTMTLSQRELVDDGTVGYVRLLISDLDSAEPVLSDEQLALLIEKAGSALAGAADALDVIATSEVLLSKKITTQDLTTDGPAVAAELRKQAAALRARAASEVAKVTEEAWGMQAFDMSGAPRRPEVTERGF